jgi:hypothetical protein
VEWWCEVLCWSGGGETQGLPCSGEEGGGVRVQGRSGWETEEGDGFW